MSITNKLVRLIQYLLLLTVLIQLVGCKTVHFLPEEKDGAPNYNVDVSKIPDAIPRAEPISRYGNPKSYVVFGRRYYVMDTSRGYIERGFASWYGTKFHAKRTSSGEPYSMLTMTAAHKTLPLPTYVQVTNLKNGRRVVVKVNDRGPFHENRIIDLSYVAARKLGISGTGLVEVRAIDPSHPETVAQGTVAVPLDKKPRIYLQIGAFAYRENAEQLCARIRSLTSYTIGIREGISNGKAIYRVQIGPLATVDVTDNLHHKLKAQGLGEAVTVIQ